MTSTAPWTSEQVEKLNEFQTCGYVHEFTCGKGSRLKATESGWVCDCCDWKQDWCHEEMLNGAPPELPLKSHWNYRVFRCEKDHGTLGKETWCEIREVHYDADGKIKFWTNEATTVIGEDPVGMVWTLDKMREALLKPLLEEYFTPDNTVFPKIREVKK